MPYPIFPCINLKQMRHKNKTTTVFSPDKGLASYRVYKAIMYYIMNRLYSIKLNSRTNFHTSIKVKLVDGEGKKRRKKMVPHSWGHYSTTLRKGVNRYDRRVSLSNPHPPDSRNGSSRWNTFRNDNIALTINSLGDLQKAIGWPSVEKSPKQRHTPMHREAL